MKPVILSKRYQVEIPRSICQELDLRPGAKFQIFRSGMGIELIPIRPRYRMKLFSRGLDKTIDRE